VFAKSMRATLEHHFDNHEDCDPSWCQFWPDSKQKADATKRQKLRNKENSLFKEMYDAIKIIHDNNTTIENLQMLRHPYNSQ